MINIRVILYGILILLSIFLITISVQQNDIYYGLFSLGIMWFVGFDMRDRLEKELKKKD